jgi:hypothetical protein
MVWESFLPEAEADFAAEQAKYERAMHSYHKELRRWEEREASNAANLASSSSQVQASSQMSSARSGNRRGKTANTQDSKPAAPIPPQRRMHADEVSLFLSLSTALKLYLGRQIDEDSINRASSLFHEYLLVYRRVSNVFYLAVADITLITFSYMVMAR